MRYYFQNQQLRTLKCHLGLKDTREVMLNCIVLIILCLAFLGAATDIPNQSFQNSG